MNEVRKFKVRERLKDLEVDDELQEYDKYLDRLEKVLDNQTCDIHKLENIVNYYETKLPSDDNIDTDH